MIRFRLVAQLAIAFERGNGRGRQIIFSLVSKGPFDRHYWMSADDRSEKRNGDPKTARLWCHMSRLLVTGSETL